MDIGDGVTEVIAKQDWMTPAEEGLQHTLHSAFESAGETGAAVKNALNGTWLGHPLHVVLTDIPLGAWTCAMVFDALAATSKNDSLDSAADACIGLGVAGAVLAAVTGLTDWQDVDPPARRVGLVHGVLNLTATALMGTSLLSRRRDNRASGRGFGLLGFLIAGAAAQLGGKLVYDYRVGVDRSVEKPLPEQFHHALAVADLQEGKPAKVTIDDTPIVLVKSGGEIFALAETCSHLSGPLSEGKVENNTIQCPWHGSRFDLRDGSVVDGPAVHRQACLEVRVVDDQVEVRRRRP